MSTFDELIRNAVEHRRAGRFAQAISLYRAAIQANPMHPDGHHGLGALAIELGDYASAVPHLSEAVALDPARAQAHSQLGEAARKLRRYEQAQACYERALALQPRDVAACTGLGIIHQERGDLEGAEAAFRQAQALAPDDAPALNNLGTILLLRGSFADAQAFLERALALGPDYPQAMINLGAVCIKRGRYAKAHELLARAVQLKPGDPIAHHNLGLALHKLGRLGDAETALTHAIQLHRAYLPAQLALAAVLKDGYRAAEARAVLENALRVSPNLPDALSSLAVILAEQGLTRDARNLLDRALAIKPTDGLRLRAALVQPVIYDSSEQVDQERARLETELTALSRQSLTIGDPLNEVGLTPFFLAYQGLDDRAVLEQLGDLYRRATPSLTYVAPHCEGHPLPASTDGRIHVGFISRFFHRHTIGEVNLGLIRNLSRSRFRVNLLRFAGPNDDLARLLDQAADDVVILPSNVDAARQQIAELQLDVLFYTDIGMDPLTYFLAFARLAPVQCTTWGHPVTSGLRSIDYYLSSGQAEPDDADAHYTERLVRLPRVLSFYDEPALDAPLKPRSDFGLDAASHLYICSQSLFKLHPDFDALLGAILSRDPEGVIILFAGAHPHWSEILRARFRRSIPAHCERIRFLPRQSRADFLQLQTIADVLLDTSPFGGGNTYYLAFAFGTPVVTWPGAQLRGRLATSLYRQMGVLDCVASSSEDYVAIAVRLGTDPAWRHAVRQRILESRHEIYADTAAVRALEEFLADAHELASTPTR
jgi:predicted O-linked N-acetylglucosamine transferase (SPINDLY family)